MASTAASGYRGLSDNSLAVAISPSGRRATTSVNVPPRSIQKLHPGDVASTMTVYPDKSVATRSATAMASAMASSWLM